jgi:hypothetical protein
MRTTVDIPDYLYRQLKARAAREGSSVKEILLRAALGELRDKKRRRGKRVKFPIIPSKSPGTLDIDNDKIAELLFP